MTIWPVSLLDARVKGAVRQADSTGSSVGGPALDPGPCIREDKD